MYHPLIRKQIILATLNREGEKKENAELFRRYWEKALSGKNESPSFSPTCIILDEKSSNWKALEHHPYRHWCRSGVFIVKFEHISHLVLVFLLLTLRR